MNLFKSFTLNVFLISAFFLPSSLVLAVETPTVKSTTTISGAQSTLVATVNMGDGKIVSQNGSTFDISFKFSNREGLQTGVKYGVRLVSGGGKYIADEKVYDESLTLYENSTVEKNITYTAPSILEGEYILLVVSNNESSFPFGVFSLGKVKLTASSKGIRILNESCYLQVEGEKGSPHYKISESMDINATEVLKLSCSAVNGTSTSQTVTPSYETRYFSRYGKVVQGIGGDATPITFVKGEKKTFSLVLPKGVSPQFYNLKVGLDNTDVYSNNVFLNYIIGGVNATIQKLSLDKDYYQRGDKGEISLIWSASTVFKISLKANVTDEGGKACIDEVVEPLVRNLQNPITTIPFEVKSNCLNPKVSVVILDEAGNVLDQKDFAFKSTSENEEISKKVNSKSTIIIVLAVLVVVGVGIYMKRKRKNVISN